MKKVIAVFLTALLLLAACGEVERPDVPGLPVLEGSVSVKGDGREDTSLLAEVVLEDASAAPVYQWYLDGQALYGANGASVQVPLGTVGKNITVGISAAGYSGELVSQPVTVSENYAEFKTMAGMYHASKVIGRVFPNESDPTAVRIEWPACGLAFNIDALGGTLKVHYETNYETTIAVYIDGQEQSRPTLVPILGGYFCEFPVTAGAHTVKILRDGEPQTTQGSGLRLKGVEFAGTVKEKPADQPLYIEIIGDSISSGVGTLGVFQPGGSAKMQDHSATHTYGVYVAQDLQADYSIVAKGGIGVIQSVGEPLNNMMSAYEYLWRWDTQAPYRFHRMPDLIILELGANDSPEHGVTTDLYKQEIAKFIEMLRRIHGGNVPILWLGRQQDNYHGEQLKAVQALIAELQDPNLYAVSFPCGSDGTGGVNGHPSAENHRAFADLVTAFIRENIGISDG